MEYYDVNDVMNKTGTQISKAYRIIKELNEKYKFFYPDAVIIQGKVPKWFYDEKMGTKKDTPTQKEVS